MTKRRIGLKQALVTAILVLLAVSTVTSLISKTVSAQATVTLYPTQGPVGQQVIVNGVGFGQYASVTISFNGKVVQQTQVTGMYGGIVAGLFNVPTGTPDGTYNVVVTDSDGNSESAPFTVGASTATPLPATSGPSSPVYTPNNGVTPTYTPFTYPTIQPQNSGLDPLIIGLIVVVVAVGVIVPVFFMFFRNRSPKRDLLLDREPTYRPEPYAPVERPAPPSSPYNQPTSRYSTPTSRYSSPSTSRYTQNTAYSRYSARPTADRYSAPASSVQQSTSGRVCPNCKRTVKGDYSVCPYCYKRMR
ncbi:MAG: hypothetical protein ABSA79_03130 [Candidatus Bathyarchaeia archaeon]|jgi:hypothetical protein